MKLYRNRLLINHTKLFVGLLVIVSVFSQCTIQKRVHQKGWYIDFHSRWKSHDVQKSEVQTDSLVVYDQIIPIHQDYKTPSLMMEQEEISTIDSVDLPKPEQLVIQNTLTSVELEDQFIHDEMKEDDPEKEEVRRKSDKRSLLTTIIFLILLFTLALIAVASLFYSDLALTLSLVGIGLLVVAYITVLLLISRWRKKKIKEIEKAHPSENNAETTTLSPEQARAKTRKAIIFFSILIVSLLIIWGSLTP